MKSKVSAYNRVKQKVGDEYDANKRLLQLIDRRIMLSNN